MDQMDDVDVYGTFTEAEAKRLGVAPLEEGSVSVFEIEQRSVDNIVIGKDGKSV